MNARLDILIAPDDLAGIGPAPLGPAATRIAIGPYQIHLDGDFRREGERSYVGGRWPESLGLRLSVDTDESAWHIESDRYGVMPLYHARDASGRILVSTRPELLARIIDTKIDPLAIAAQTLVGFDLDDGSPFERVQRVRPRARLSWSPLRGHEQQKVAVPTDYVVGVRWWEALEPTFQAARDADAILELSGGVDSRMVLAIAGSMDLLPSRAFTIGHPDDEDVRLARRVADAAGIKHIVVPPPADGGGSMAANLSFVARSGYGVNATTSSWLPDAFSHLADERTAQLGGGGGEIASGFYDSPIDNLVRSDRTARWWIRKRVLRAGITLSSLLDPDAAHDLTEQTISRVQAVFDRTTDSWRERAHRFYLTQRVTNAGGPVLAASSAWYQPIQPLLERPHVAWASSLNPADRHHRGRQLQLLQQIDPALARIPFSSGRRTARTVIGRTSNQVCRAMQVARKSWRRTKGQRAAHDLGAAATAIQFASNSHVIDAIDRLIATGPFDARAVEATLANPAAHAHEIGVLTTFALAGKSLERVSAATRSTRRQPRKIRRAA